MGLTGLKYGFTTKTRYYSKPLKNYVQHQNVETKNICLTGLKYGFFVSFRHE
jgi:hypothetical protein